MWLGVDFGTSKGTIYGPSRRKARRDLHTFASEELMAEWQALIALIGAAVDWRD